MPNDYPYQNTASDKFAKLEYMLRCKRDVLYTEAPEGPEKDAAINKLDDAICRANYRFSVAFADGR